VLHDVAAAAPRARSQGEMAGYPARNTADAAVRERVMWQCPRCGVKLVSRNLSHSCGGFSVKEVLAGKGGHARALFGAVGELIAACGPYDVAPAKTRVAFLSKVRFASVNRAGASGIDVHLVLPRKIDSARFWKVEKLGKLYVHHLKLAKAEELDDELREWVR